jgi:DNA polymerase-3 subunit beta
MKISCSQEELARYLQIVSHAIASKTTLPILNGILLETRDNALRCLATDLEIAIEVMVPNIQVINPGSLVVPGKTFVEIVKHLPRFNVEIEFDENEKMVSINSKNLSYQLPLLPIEEFPTFPEAKSEEKLEVNGEKLREAIHQTMYATLGEDPRPFVTSILWEISETQMRLVATDVNRLAIKDIPIHGGIHKNALVPVRSLREIAGIFGSNPESILEINITEKLIFIKSSGIKFSSRLIEAQFPRYEQVIPKDFSGNAQMNRNDLIEALERTALVSSSIKVNINVGNSLMIITAKEPDKGHSKEEISIEVSGKEIEMGFNVRYLLDFLKAVDSDQILFKYVQDQKPALVQGEKDHDYQYVVMPLKLSASS